MNYDTLFPYINKTVGIELSSGVRIRGKIVKLENDTATFVSDKGQSEIDVKFIAIILLLNRER